MHLPRPRRWLVTLIRIPLLVYAGIVVVLFAIQTRLIFPGSETQGKPEAVVPTPPDAELVTLTTARGDRVVALFGKALSPDGSPRPDASACPTLLYFYGNAMCLRDASDEFGRFRRLGANVLIPEYVGFGMSGGKPGESGCRETAEAALAHLGNRRDVDRGRVVAAGWSLGGAVALDLASRHPVAGVATFCTFTRMADVSRRLFPFLPGSLLLRHRFENVSKIGRVGCPVLLGHGRDDRTIPFAMADRLAEAARGPVTRVTIEGADHNDFFQTGGERVRTALSRFIDQLPRRP
jgi:pimeloyl-ACP methyl ester carboxylesterase